MAQYLYGLVTDEGVVNKPSWHCCEPDAGQKQFFPHSVDHVDAHAPMQVAKNPAVVVGPGILRRADKEAVLQAVHKLVESAGGRQGWGPRPEGVLASRQYCLGIKSDVGKQGYRGASTAESQGKGRSTNRTVWCRSSSSFVMMHCVGADSTNEHNTAWCESRSALLCV